MLQHFYKLTIYISNAVLDSGKKYNDDKRFE